MSEVPLYKLDVSTPRAVVAVVDADPCKTPPSRTAAVIAEEHYGREISGGGGGSTSLTSQSS